MNREAWHAGWQRFGDVISMGHPFCAGCGASLGLACLAIDPDFVPPSEPTWPFDRKSCPICELRDKLYTKEQNSHEPLGMLPTAANLYKKLRATQKELAALRATHTSRGSHDG